MPDLREQVATILYKLEMADNGETQSFDAESPNNQEWWMKRADRILILPDIKEALELLELKRTSGEKIEKELKFIYTNYDIKQAIKLIELWKQNKLVKLADDQTLDIPSEIFETQEASLSGFTKRSFSNAGWRKVTPIGQTFLQPLKSGKYQF